MWHFHFFGLKLTSFEKKSGTNKVVSPDPVYCFLNMKVQKLGGLDSYGGHSDIVNK